MSDRPRGQCELIGKNLYNTGTIETETYLLLGIVKFD